MPEQPGRKRFALVQSTRPGSPFFREWKALCRGAELAPRSVCVLSRHRRQLIYGSGLAGQQSGSGQDEFAALPLSLQELHRDGLLKGA